MSNEKAHAPAAQLNNLNRGELALENPAKNDEETVERVAKALYEEKVRQAKAAIDSLAFNSDVIVDLFRKLSAESYTAQVVVFGSYMEHMSVELFKLHLRHTKSRTEEERIFGPNGPLGSFSARIDLAHSLYWIPNSLHSDLHTFRKIRNLFAHEAYKVASDDQKISDLLNNIKVDPDEIAKRLVDALGDEYKISPHKLTREDRLLIKLLFVAGNMFEALLIGPVARAYQVEPTSILGDWDNAPKAAKSIRRNMARAMLMNLKFLSQTSE